MKLIFIRHGDPDYSIDSLTERGWREAELLADRVCRWDVKQFYSSPLGRAKDTAGVSLKRLNREAIVLDWLREFYVPVKDPLTGKDRIPWDFMPNCWTKEPLLYDKDRWVKAPVMQTGNIEPESRKVFENIDMLLAEHGYIRDGNIYRVKKQNDDTLVFFCHLGVQFLILSHLIGLSASVLWQGFFVAPTSVTVVCTEERVKGEAFFRCKKLGDTSHLYVVGEKPSDSGFFREQFLDDFKP